MAGKPYTKKELQKTIDQKNALIDKLKSEGVDAVGSRDRNKKNLKKCKVECERLENIVKGLKKKNKELVDDVIADVDKPSR